MRFSATRNTGGHYTDDAMTPQDIGDWLGFVWNLGLGLRLVLIVAGVGYAFRAMPLFPNKWLWVVCGAAGAAIFPFMASPRDTDTPGTFALRVGLLGLFLGLGAWAMHDRVLSKNGLGLETKIPVVKNIIELVDRAGDYRRGNRKHRHR